MYIFINKILLHYVINMIFDYSNYVFRIEIWLNCDKILAVYRNLLIHPIKHTRGIKTKTKQVGRQFHYENIKSQPRGQRVFSHAWIKSTGASVQKASESIAEVFCINFENTWYSFLLGRVYVLYADFSDSFNNILWPF